MELAAITRLACSVACSTNENRCAVIAACMLICNDLPMSPTREDNETFRKYGEELSAGIVWG